MSISLPGLPRVERGGARLPKLPGLAGPRQASRLPRIDPALPRIGEEERNRPWLSPPGWWEGSIPEWSIFWAHDHVEREVGVYQEDWFFQTPLFGDIWRIGFVPDFIELPSLVTIDINEEEVSRDIERLRASILSSLREPFVHVIIDAEDATANPVFYLEEALQGVSHSRFGRLI